MQRSQPKCFRRGHIGSRPLGADRRQTSRRRHPLPSRTGELIRRVWTNEVSPGVTGLVPGRQLDCARGGLRSVSRLRQRLRTNTVNRSNDRVMSRPYWPARSRFFRMGALAIHNPCRRASDLSAIAHEINISYQRSHYRSGSKDVGGASSYSSSGRSR